MFTKLVFDIDDEKVEFESHELLRIASYVAKKVFDTVKPNLGGEEIFACSPEKMTTVEQNLKEYLNSCLVGFHDPRTAPNKIKYLRDTPFHAHAMIPNHVIKLNTADRWLLAIQKLQKRLSNKDGATNNLNGIWVVTNDHLILIKTHESGNYYVSDHGNFYNIVPEMEKLIFEEDWTDSDTIEIYKSGYNRFTELLNTSHGSVGPQGAKSKKEKERVKIVEQATIRELGDSLLAYINANKLEIEDLIKSIYGDNTAECKRQLTAVYSMNPLNIKRFIEGFIEQLKYMNALINAFEEWKRANAELYHSINVVMTMYIMKMELNSENYEIVKNNILTYKKAALESTNDLLEEAKRTFISIVKHNVLLEQIKKTNLGLASSLYRPAESAYGDVDEGSAYPEFARDVKTHLDSGDNQKELALQMRKILKGEAVSDAPIFLPNLVVAWFVAEPIRGPWNEKHYVDLSFTTSLMLLDMVEKGVVLKDVDGVSLYDWTRILADPNRQDNERKVRDLYGKYVRFKEFDGVHPRAHYLSGNEHLITQLSNNVRLSPVRQKEGSVIIHWLSLVLDNVRAVSCADAVLVEPNYTLIDKLLKACDGNKPTASIKKNASELRKYKILVEKIIPKLRARMCGLDNMLSLVHETAQQINAQGEEETKVDAVTNNNELEGGDSAVVATPSPQVVVLEQEAGDECKSALLTPSPRLSLLKTSSLTRPQRQELRNKRASELEIAQIDSFVARILNDREYCQQLKKK